MTDPFLSVRVANYYTLRRSLEQFQNLYRGAFASTIRDALKMFRDYAASITHEETGTLASSHKVAYGSRAMSGYVYPDPSFIKEARGRGRAQSVGEYAAIEHARGGSHAYYARTMTEFGDSAMLRGVEAFLGRLPGGVHV